MNKHLASAVDVAHAYINAIASKDVPAILALSAEDVMCTSPLGRIKGLESFRGFQEGFARMITNVSVLALHGDDQQAVVVYDVETHPVPHALVAELLRVRNGKLTSTEVIYDGTPFAAYAATTQPH